ncbi:MAG: glutathione-disulfide reductase [SAR324 cluster bacterium]|nr:glutathione-disulfide reductase [SAR324 cluster bacterium]
MAKYDYDLFVIGGGSGGVRAARMSAGYGARVALCEERYMGGTCVNVGCIPKKLLVYGAHYAEDFEEAAGFGWSVPKAKFDWKLLIANKDKEITRLNGIYRDLLENAGVRVLDGRGSLLDAHTVALGEERFTAEYILVATGGWPAVPDAHGSEHAITSNEAFFLEELPKRVLIVGGGYIAVEFAGIFRGLGCQVTQIYRGPLFMRGFDDDARRFLADEMRKKGVDLRYNTTGERIDKTGDGLRMTLNDGSTITADIILCATGRNPNTAGLGLEELGVKLNWRGGIVVDELYRSSAPSIYALGDVIDKVALTPVALAEGMAVARTLFGGEPTEVDYGNIATTVFSQPPLGTVGLTEEAARTHHGEVTIYKSTFTALKHTLSGSGEKTLMKLIVDKRTDVVVGVHMVGPEAGEIIQGIAIALKCGATKAQFDATIGIHPTSAEEFVTMRTPEPESAQAAAG